MRGRSRFGGATGAVWRPGPEQVARSKLANSMKRWGFSSLEEFHRASVDRPDWFWPAAAEDLGVVFQGTPGAVRDESRGRAFPRWFSGQTLNAVWSCVERHAADPQTAGKKAVIYEADAGHNRSLTYAQLRAEVDVFAGAIQALGIRKGDRVTLFGPPTPEAAVVLMGCAKIGAIFVPAFSGYGSDALATRLQASESALLVTVDGTTRRGKSIPMKATADAAVAISPSVRNTIVVRNSGQDAPMAAGRDHWWDTLPALAGSTPPATVALDPNDPLFVLYTSGTTGAPKGIVHSHAGMLLKAAIDFGYVFDIQDDDVVTWIADMGWMLGPLMLIGGLHLGSTVVLVEGVPDFPDAGRLWRIVERNRSTFLGIAPTAARGLRTALNGGRPDADLSTLRAFASTGEAWDEPTWHWLFDTVGGKRLPILNYSGGTEIGGGIISGYTIAPHAPASFCGPCPGMDVDVYDADGRSTDEVGELVVLNTWPGMAHSFWRDDARFLDTYWSRWPDVWVHGDLASVDARGFWHIHGRSDDTLKIGGRRIGPAEIESALVAQAGVAEAGVIGAPDEMKGQTAVAFVVARPGAKLEESALSTSLIAAVGKGMLPSRIHIVETLPKTKNGKIMRRAIRARYLGEPVGDLSALDPSTPLESIPVRD
ncbi:acetyl-CoA synthetase [Alicycliphilus denitrificans]|uniref:AMP-binding protein n=1 Tax=Alicycliphilus denitrificans TaxID=179636 RepID=UPI0009646713|nr:AMP-binding protein [Alicycliphilus denitrificans]MBN9574540.1 AMP-binding protein [Alicycliphilus denitrificans]OJW89273.1 MAG: acyl-CoA synthetase [Alicycliphilus sp. 69-12]BCN40516.1 acetyl-CoA synthetase [Alicycliphilus denitrificans]